MGAYTWVEANVVLRRTPETEALVHWLDPDNECTDTPDVLSNFEFFKLPSCHSFFGHTSTILLEDTVTLVIGEFEFKCYNDEIEHLWELLKQFYISGHYYSRYEEFVLRFDHVTGANEGEPGACPFCGKMHDRPYSCQ